MLPDYFQRKLNLARWRLCGGNQACARNAIAGLIEDSKAIRWRGKIRPIEQIKELGPELNVRVFRKQPRVIILKNGRVKLRHAGSDQRIPPEVASEIRWIRKR